MGCIKEADKSDYAATKAANPKTAQANQDATGDPVNVVTGAFTLSEQDVAFPVQRLWLNLTRHYNNQRHDNNPASPSGPFGRGWSHSLNLRLEAQPDGYDVVYVDDQGAALPFTWDATRSTYSPRPGGLGLRLWKQPDGGYRLRQFDGLTADFSPSGRLVAMLRPGTTRDSRLDFRYDDQGRLLAVSGAGGRSLYFEYQQGPLVRAIRDHTGRRWRYEYNGKGELREVVDPAGRVRRYQYATCEVLVTDENGQITPRDVSGLHRLFAYTWQGDRHEPIVELTNQYTSDGRVYRQTDALGQVTAFDYNRFTRTTYVTDPDGWTTVYCYDEAGNTTKVRRPRGGVTEYIFDDRRNLVAEIDPDGHRTEYVELVDPQRLAHAEDFGRRAIANRSSYVALTASDMRVGYDRYGNRPLVRDALGNTTRFFEYTPFGRPGRVELPDGSVVRFTYDERSGLPTRMERDLRIGRDESMHGVQTWRYDGWGNVVRHEEWAETADGRSEARRVRAWSYDADGQNPLSRQDWVEGAGPGADFAAEERYTWDPLGRLTSVTTLRRSSPGAAPQADTVQFGYDAIGREVWRIDPSGTGTVRELDAAGHAVESYRVVQANSDMLKAVSPAMKQTRWRWEYDAMGREVAAIDSTGATTRSEWDARGLPVSVTDPSGYRVRYEHDRDGNRIRETSGTGYSIEIDYDTSGRPIVQRDSLGQVETRSYDALGRLASVTTPSGGDAAVTRYCYDALGRLAEIVYPDATCERFLQDERGNVVRRERGMADQAPLAVDGYTYDGLGRLIGVSSGAPGRLITRFSLRYDDSSGEVHIIDALGHRTRQLHDTAGNLVRKIDAEGRILQLEYDGQARVRRRWSADGFVDAYYEYDPLDQLTLAREGGIEYRWRYDAASRVVRHDQALHGQTMTVAYEYDAAGRLMRKSVDPTWWQAYHYAPDAPVPTQVDLPTTSIHLTTDPAGRVTRERWADGGVTDYRYQPDGALVELESRDARGQLVFSQRLIRDGCGRPVEDKRKGASVDADYRYHYDPLDRLERVQSLAPGGPAEFRRYRYDDRGNRIQEYRGGALHVTYRYDEADQLVEVRGPDGAVETLAYDRCGNLVQRGARRFGYDAAQRLRQVTQADTDAPLVSYEYAATGERAVLAAPAGLERIVYDGVHEILSSAPREQRSAFWGFHVDTLLAVDGQGPAPRRAYTAADGSVVAVGGAERTTDYDPFGNLLAGHQPPTAFGFCGKRFDPETGLYHARARAYDPSSGRFTQPDPLGFVDGPNLYLYARNNPLAYVDSFGFTAVKTAQGRLGNATAAESAPSTTSTPPLRRREIVYRAVTDADVASILAGKGIMRPESGVTPLQHVLGHPGKSPWISTTRSMESAIFFATHQHQRPSQPIVAIDLSAIYESPILDLSTSEKAEAVLGGPTKTHARAVAFASFHQEVLVRRYVPPEAVVGFVSWYGDYR